MRVWIAKIKELPRIWFPAVALLCLLLLWWIKKIRGLDSLKITTEYPAVPGMAIVMMILSLVALSVIFGYMMRARQFSLHHMFLICGLLLGSLYLFILPPLSAPDEWAHYVSAYKVSNQFMGIEAVDEKGHVMVQAEEMAAKNGAFPDAGQYQYFWTNYFGKETGTEMIPANRGVNGTYMLPYLPQALGITLARLLGRNFATRILFGRVANLVWSVLAISQAIKWMPFGKKYLFGVMMLPMVLHELASNSYDAWILAFSMLFIAYCMKLGFEKPKVEKKDVMILAGLIGLLAPCKLVYTPLIGLCLLIPMRKFGNIKRWGIAAGGVLAAVLLMVLLSNASLFGSLFGESTTGPVIDWAGEPGYTVGYFLENPLQFARIILNTLTNESLLKNYGQTMLGYALGWQDPTLTMPTAYFSILVLLLVAFLIPAEGEAKMLDGKQKAWIGVIVLVVVVAVLTSMLLFFTPMGSACVLGIQGRYFLPILPLAAMILFKDGNLVWKRDPEKLLIFGYTAFHLLLLITLFGQVISVHLINAA